MKNLRDYLKIKKEDSHDSKRLAVTGSKQGSANDLFSRHFAHANRKPFRDSQKDHSDSNAKNSSSDSVPRAKSQKSKEVCAFFWVFLLSEINPSRRWTRNLTMSN